MLTEVFDFKDIEPPSPNPIRPILHLKLEAIYDE